MDGRVVQLTTMAAATRSSYGGPEVVELTRQPIPTVDADEVLVEVHAAGLDRGVCHLMEGKPYVIRLAFGPRRPRQSRMGLDVSGVVVEVGDEVTRFTPGDEVYGIAKGSFAEFAVATEAKLDHKPSALTHESAAVVPVSGLTALQAIRDKTGLQPGDRVAVFGASGGVGTFAVQVAKAAGAMVTGVCSAEKSDLVRSIGADDVVDYASYELATLVDRFDVILFIAGDQTLRQLRSMLTKKGTLVVIGGEDGGNWFGLGRQFGALLLSPFVSQRLTALVSKENHEDIGVLSQMISAGSLTPIVGSVYPLDETADAIRALEERRARGKIAIAVRP